MDTVLLALLETTLSDTPTPAGSTIKMGSYWQQRLNMMILDKEVLCIRRAYISAFGKFSVLGSDDEFDFELVEQ